ncbi:MAG: chloride channel protein, partial [Cyanobacteriota bacterium]
MALPPTAAPPPSVTPTSPRRPRLLQPFLLVNAIGIVVALGIWLYGREIALLNSLRLQLAAHLPPWLVLPLLGLVGGGLAGALIGLEPAAKGSGIVQVLQWLRGRPIPMGWQVAVVKLIASGLAIGSGIPVGPEGPSIQIGASVARETSRGLGNRHERLAVAIGSGAGLAAIFHAPLGGLAYFLEELQKRTDLRVNATAAFATFAAVFWTRLLNSPGGGPLLWRNLVPLSDYPSPLADLRLIDLPLLLGLGALAGLLALPYQRCILGLRRRLAALRQPPWRLLALVGLVSGVGWALLPPEFENPAQVGLLALGGVVDPAQALLMLGLQGAGTALAVAADAPGGFLAPALVVGACLGTLVQQLALLIFHTAPNTLMFAGGGAFLGALTRTPLTAILLTFELSKDYRLVLPIGFCTLTAIAVAQRFERHTIFETIQS